MLMVNTGRVDMYATVLATGLACCARANTCINAKACNMCLTQVKELASMVIHPVQHNIKGRFCDSDVANRDEPLNKPS